MGEFTHFNQHGDAIMVDISKKAETAREAIAEGRISMNQECFDQLKAGSIGKGDVLGVARIAGIMGAKKTFGADPSLPSSKSDKSRDRF